MGETTQNNVYLCPVCGKTFNSIHSYAIHINEHSAEAKKKEQEEEKKRREDQMRVDTANLGKLYDAYKEAEDAYLKARNEYSKKYNNPELTWNESIEATKLWDNLFKSFL